MTGFTRPDDTFINWLQTELCNPENDISAQTTRLDPLPYSTFIGELDISMLRMRGLMGRIITKVNKARTRLGQQDNPQAKEKVKKEIKALESMHDIVLCIGNLEFGKKYPIVWDIDPRKTIMFIVSGNKLYSIPCDKLPPGVISGHNFYPLH